MKNYLVRTPAIIVERPPYALVERIYVTAARATEHARDLAAARRELVKWRAGSAFLAAVAVGLTVLAATAMDAKRAEPGATGTATYHQQR